VKKIGKKDEVSEVSPMDNASSDDFHEDYWMGRAMRRLLDMQCKKKLCWWLRFLLFIEPTPEHYVAFNLNVSVWSLAIMLILFASGMSLLSLTTLGLIADLLLVAPLTIYLPLVALHIKYDAPRSQLKAWLQQQK
jgi:hypothetical protein